MASPAGFTFIWNDHVWLLLTLTGGRGFSGELQEELHRVCIALDRVRPQSPLNLEVINKGRLQDRFQGSRPALFRGRHFRDEVIVLSVRCHLRYRMSYGDLGR
jgi:hypothetical protein